MSGCTLEGGVTVLPELTGGPLAEQLSWVKENRLWCPRQGGQEIAGPCGQAGDQALHPRLAFLEPRLLSACCRGMSEASGTVSLLWPSSLPTAWNQKGAPERVTLNPTGCSCAAGPRAWEGPQGAHSRDVSGWVCLWRPQEESSTCPRNAGGGTCPPPPRSLCAGQAESRKRAPSGQRGICPGAKPTLRTA